MLSQNWHRQIDELVQQRRNFSALAMELCLSGKNPLKWYFMLSKEFMKEIECDSWIQNHLTSILYKQTI